MGFDGATNAALATSQPASSSGGGLGKAFIATQAITGLGQLAAGFLGSSAHSAEAELVEEQSRLFRREADRDARQVLREGRKFEAKQGHKFRSSGVTLEGSPLLVMEETRRLVKEEADAIRTRGEARARLARLQASIGRSKGRNTLLGGLFSMVGTGFNTYFLGKRYGIFGDNKKGTPPAFDPNDMAIRTTPAQVSPPVPGP